MTKSDNKDVFHFRPGWMVIDCSSASGGIHYDRELVKNRPINRGNGVQEDHKTRKTVDHVQFCGAVDALVKRVDYILRKHGTRTPIGWFVDEAHLKQVQIEVAELQAEAVILNEHAAKKAQSARRAHIQIVPLRLDLNHKEAVQEITRTIRSVLTDIRDALRAGDISSLHKLKIRARNLDQLAVGFQADAIRFALERIPLVARDLREASRAAERATRNKGGSVEDAANAGRAAAARCGGRADLEAIEAALTHFTPSDSVADFDSVEQVAS